MTPQKRQRFMFGLLIASVIFGLYMRPWERRIRPNVEVAPTGDAGSLAVMPQENRSQPVAVTYATAWPDRDPFTRANEFHTQASAHAGETADVAEPSLDLQGIMSVDGQVLCVIDGQTRGVGSIVDGWRLDKIEAKGVWVSQGGVRHYVPLP